MTIPDHFVDGRQPVHKQQTHMTAIDTRTVRHDTSRRVTNHVTWVHGVNIERRIVIAHGRLLEHPDDHDPDREIADVTRKSSNIDLEEEFDRRKRIATTRPPCPYAPISQDHRDRHAVVAVLPVRVSARRGCDSRRCVDLQESNKQAQSRSRLPASIEDPRCPLVTSLASKAHEAQQ
jgi:hypothetical protein